MSTASIISFPIGNHRVASLDELPSKNGFTLKQEDLRKIPKNLFTNLIAQLQKHFAKHSVDFSSQKMVLPASSDVEMTRIFQFAKRAGLGPFAQIAYERPKWSSEFETRINTATQEKTDELHFSDNHILTKARGYCNGIGGAISLTNVVTKVLAIFGITAPLLVQKIVNHATIPTYKIGAGLHVLSGYQESKAASKIEDREGKVDGIKNFLDGALVVFGTIDWSAYLYAEAANPAFTALLSKLTWGVFGLGSLVEMTIAYAHIRRNEHFREKLEAFTKNSELSELEKTRGALHFLLDQISITPEELQEITSTSPPEKVEERVIAYTKEKIARFKRRTGIESLQEATQKIVDILQRLTDPSSRPEAISEGKKLLNLITLENTKNLLYYSFMMATALIFFTVFLFVNFSTFGAIPVLLASIYATYRVIHWAKIYFQERNIITN